MQTAIQIIKGREMPPPETGSSRAVYPWRAMDVGDCFEVPVARWGDRRKAQISMAAKAVLAAKKTGRKFATRSTSDTITVWRIA